MPAQLHAASAFEALSIRGLEVDPTNLIWAMVGDASDGLDDPSAATAPSGLICLHPGPAAPRSLWALPRSIAPQGPWPSWMQPAWLITAFFRPGAGILFCSTDVRYDSSAVAASNSVDSIGSGLGTDQPTRGRRQPGQQEFLSKKGLFPSLPTTPSRHPQWKCLLPWPSLGLPIENAPP